MGMQWEGALGVGEESQYGVGVAPTRYIAPLRAGSPTTPTKVDDDRATGQRWRYRSPLTGLDYTFDWEQWVEGRNFGEILKWALGAVSTINHPDGGSGEKRHTFSHVSTLPSFSLSLDRNVSANPTKRYVGARINSLTLANGPREALIATPEGFAQKEDDQAALAPSLAEFEYDPFMFHQLSAYIGLNAATPVYDPDLERIQFVISNDLVTDKVTANSSLYIADLPVGRLLVTGEFDREFESLAEYNSFVANQQLDIRAVWLGDSMGTAFYRLEIDVPNARITSLPLPEISGASERAVYTVAFEALYYSTDSKVVSVVYDNDIASY